MRRVVTIGFICLIAINIGEDACSQVNISKEIESSDIQPSVTGATVGAYLKENEATQNLASSSIQLGSQIAPTLGFELNPDAEDDDILQIYLSAGPQISINKVTTVTAGLRALHIQNLSQRSRSEHLEPYLTFDFSSSKITRAAAFGANVASETILSFSSVRRMQIESAISPQPEVKNTTEAFIWLSARSAMEFQTGGMLNVDAGAQMVEAGPAVQYAATDEFGISVDYLQIFESGDATSTRASLTLSYQP